MAAVVGQTEILDMEGHNNMKEEAPEDSCMTILTLSSKQTNWSNKNISGLLKPGTTPSVEWHAKNCTMRMHQTLIKHGG